MPIEVIKFEADWCGPCDQQTAILEDFHSAPVEVVDVDENQDKAQEYGVRGLPTLVIESDGEEVERFTGLTQLAELEEAVSSAGGGKR